MYSAYCRQPGETAQPNQDEDQDLASRCGGSLVARQTSGAGVPGSNPASTTMRVDGVIPT